MNAPTPCARNLPQHFNGCTCTVSTATAGEVLGLDLVVTADEPGFCAECGSELAVGDSPGVLVHVDEHGDRDYDRDADHVAIDENQLEGMFFVATETDDDFAFTAPEAFEMNRVAAVAAADNDNEFEMRMSGIALLSTINELGKDEAVDYNDRFAITRLKFALDVTDPGADGVARSAADDVEELRDALRYAIKAGDNNLRTYEGKTSRQWRVEAAARRVQSAESFARSDTDGALTQWAADVTASRYDAYAELAADGGISDFPALMDTNGNLVPAKLVNTRFGQSWMLLDENGESSGEWVNPSKAATAEKRNAAMAKKGYQVGLVRAKAKIAMTEGLTQFPYRYRADSGFNPNAEVVATAETED